MLNLLWPAIIAGSDYKIKKHREENDNVYTYADDNIKITTYHNYGAFLNMGEKKPAVVLFLSAVITLILGLIFIITLTMKGKNALKFGLGILLGGAFSNTYDRISKGYVVDYLSFPHAPGKLKNIVFNISDFAIIIGSLISVWCDKV